MKDYITRKVITTSVMITLLSVVFLCRFIPAVAFHVPLNNTLTEKVSVSKVLLAEDTQSSDFIDIPTDTNNNGNSQFEKLQKAFNLLHAPASTQIQGVGIEDPYKGKGTDSQGNVIDTPKCTIGDGFIKSSPDATIPVNQAPVSVYTPEFQGADENLKVYCSTGINSGDLNDYFLTSESPAIDAARMSGLALMRTFVQAKADPNQYIMSAGMFPLTNYITYLQRDPGLSEYTLEEASALLSSYPEINTPREVMTDGLVTGSDSTIPESTTPTEYNDYTITPSILGEYSGYVFEGLFQKHPSLLFTLPLLYLNTNGFSSSIDPNTAYANALSIFMTSTETDEESLSQTNWGIYKTGNVKLLGVMSLFSEELTRQLPIKKEFFCKDTEPGKDTIFFGDHPNYSFDSYPFFKPDGWKQTCAPIGEYAWTDKSFTSSYPYESNGFGTIAYSMPIGHDWFEAASYCMARGGRLPRTDELMYIAARKWSKGDQEPFFIGNIPVQHSFIDGILIPTGDFIYGSGAGINATVAALYVPLPGKDIPGSLKDFLGIGGNNCLKAQDLFKNTPKGPDSAYYNWANAALCSLKLDYVFDDPTKYNYGENIPMATMTDPGVTNATIEMIPSGYRSSQDLKQVSSFRDKFTSATLCVYD